MLFKDNRCMVQYNIRNKTKNINNTPIYNLLSRPLMKPDSGIFSPNTAETPGLTFMLMGELGWAI